MQQKKSYRTYAERKANASPESIRRFYQYQKDYLKEKYIPKQFLFSKVKDADIIKAIEESPNSVDFIRKCIRNYINDNNCSSGANCEKE